MRGAVGVVTGLHAETACLEVFAPALRPPVACAAARPDRAAAAARTLIERGCRALVSFGIAGGLTPELTAGDVVLADAVVAPDGRVFETDPAWRQRLSASIGDGVHLFEGRLAGIDGAVRTAAAKHLLTASTGALAADMESCAVARAAAAAALPFIVVRAVADGHRRTIPDWIGPATIDSDGRPRLTAILGGLLRRPGDLPRLAALGRDAARGYRALRGVALRAGPLFRFEVAG